MLSSLSGFALILVWIANWQKEKLLCDQASGRKEAFRAGAIGAITTNDGRDDIASVVPLPTSALTDKDHDIVKSINSTK